MADIEQVIRAALLADGTVAGLVGTRIYPLVLPKNPTLPALVYQSISRVGDRTLEGPLGRSRRRIQLSCWAAGYAGSKALAAACRAALDGTAGVLGNSPDTLRVGAITLENEIDDYDTDLGGDGQPEAVRVVQDYLTAYREE